MLANIEQFPNVGIFVLVSFVLIFTVILMKLFNKHNKEIFNQAASLPLEAGERLEENKNE
tara:strand:- start:14477 stop:14656 length:180 start_codon:yes stop_codon:yes gene_type:complete